MNTRRPHGFTPDFLEWFRVRTEAAWATYQQVDLTTFAARGAGGCDWQRGTRWLTPGLSQEEITQVEQQLHLVVPPDLRLFLQCLHTVDRPMRCAGWSDYREGEEQHLIAYTQPSFYNWRTDVETLRNAQEAVITGLEFSIEYGAVWPSAWGSKPVTLKAQKARLREMMAAAPRVIPICGHRYLLAEPNRAEPDQGGHPIFSIMQADIAVLAADLRSYLLYACVDLLGLNPRRVRKEITSVVHSRVAHYTAIPFWGELLTV